MSTLSVEGSVSTVEGYFGSDGIWGQEIRPTWYSQRKIGNTSSVCSVLLHRCIALRSGRVHTFVYAPKSRARRSTMLRASVTPLFLLPQTTSQQHLCSTRAEDTTFIPLHPALFTGVGPIAVCSAHLVTEERGLSSKALWCSTSFCFGTKHLVLSEYRICDPRKRGLL